MTTVAAFDQLDQQALSAQQDVSDDRQFPHDRSASLSRVPINPFHRLLEGSRRDFCLRWFSWREEQITNRMQSLVRLAIL
jgi:hypothetical protein